MINSNTSGEIAVDIVVPTRGRGRRIKDLLDSILNSDYSNFQLWIVDQSIDDVTEQEVSFYVKIDARIHYLRNKDQGSNIARNIGAAHGQAPLLLFTDDDCLVTPGWIRMMVKEFQKNSSCAVFGRIEALEESGHNPGQKLSDMLPMAVKDVHFRQVYEDDPYDLGYGHGANMGFRRDCFEKIQGFDNFLGAGGIFRSWPEKDIGFRILIKGGRIIYTPEALVFHSHWRDWPSVKNTFYDYAYGAGASVAKYVRCGHYGALVLLLDWFLQMGIRQILSGLLKWRSLKKVEVGLLQLFIPWIGMLKSLRYAIDKEEILYKKTI